MKTTESSRLSQSLHSRGHAGRRRESDNIFLMQNNFQMAETNRRAGIAALHLAVLVSYLSKNKKNITTNEALI